MKIIATNKKATFDYQISLNLDAGIVLSGPEVKSLRNNSSSLKESYIENDGGELWLCNCHIKKYESSNEKDHNPTRKRKLLLNKKELNKTLGSVRKEGFSGRALAVGWRPSAVEPIFGHGSLSPGMLNTPSNC